MHPHERFHYPALHDLAGRLDELGLHLPMTNDLSVLARPLELGARTVPNRLAVQPMEGCDCTPEGAPTDLTRRRYRRSAAGGAGLIWVEACAVVPEGRANPHQMMLTDGTADAVARILDDARAAARNAMGADHAPVFVLQMTHSGRYSRPHGAPAPILAHHSPVLDARTGVAPDHPLVTDDELDRLQDAYVRTARLAARVGFDGVDVKACHGYLACGLLAAFTRPSSRYGGPEPENRTRLVREVHARIRHELPDLIATSRMNAWDPVPWPHGWGVARDDGLRPDPSEPTGLARALHEQGAPCVNITLGNPYYRAHFNRPLDSNVVGSPGPDEHPLEGVVRLVTAARDVAAACPGLAVVGSGYSYLRQHAPQVAAGVVAEGWAAIVGLGREAFAYPEFARDILREGRMDPRRCCVACSRCTQLMRDGQPSGCPVRDRRVYGPLYREGRARGQALERS